jgi:hypothetical protein
MKHYIIILLIFAGVFTSCTDFLNVTTEKFPNEGAYFATDKDATDAVNDLYWIFYEEATFGRNLNWEQVGADDITFGTNRTGAYNNLVDFNYVGTENGIADGWTQFNRYIARSNWVVYSLLRKGNLSPVETIRLGEAYFMRAFCHFYIAYRYGRADQGAPFDRYEDYSPYETQIPEQRATVMENYQLIIEDLEKAAGLLPFFEEYGEDDHGRAHKAAAWAYMVKVYAYWAQHDDSKWDLIPALVDKIETEGRRGLLTNYADVFKIENNWSKEYIWSVNSSGHNRAGSEWPGILLENGAWGLTNSGWGSLKPQLSLYEAFASNDTRRGVTLFEYGDEFTLFGVTHYYYSTGAVATGLQIAKYMEPFTYGENDDWTTNPHLSADADRPTTDLNISLIRHAEMVLFKAEALIMKGQGGPAATELNKLASRAGLGNNKYSNATMNDLKYERRCELAGEWSDRLMDLKRWKDWDKLEAPHRGRRYSDNRPESTNFEIYEIRPARTFNPNTDIVFPYPPDDVVKANGKLKQNPIG